MKKIVVPEQGDSGVLEVSRTTQPDVADDDVKIKIKASGINYTSIEKRRGNYHGVTTNWDVPYDTGMEGAGVITKVGNRVNNWTVGDRVGMMQLHGGTWREYTTVSTSTDVADDDGITANPNTYELLFELPDSISYKEGAAVTISFLTAYGILIPYGKMSNGDNILLHSAAGGVGSATVQIANQYDVTTFGLASSQEKLAFATCLGLDHSINYTEENTVDEINRVLGDSDGIDLALDSIGGNEFKNASEVMNINGRVVTYGVSSGMPGVVSTPKLIFDNVTVCGFHLLGALLDDSRRKQMIDGFEHLLESFESSGIHVEIDKVFEMEDIAAAHDYLEGRNSMGSMIMDVDL